ncbi:SpoIID/LytB domain-containing protein [Tomitella fengzijianii]|uniref:SpoIID/LytB domain-containing protein n=1 Tax=Tomitella fengzijianii TaxID=2597660 RepID=A0A516WZX5_9ACTN|nr:SpoIID/LytB domain-containing protein [Tomitella fengzijianii]QDQ96365.1 SpoIID/LytB domain-containing protein [Tomitella fengzijianii]
MHRSPLRNTLRAVRRPLSTTRGPDASRRRKRAAAAKLSAAVSAPMLAVAAVAVSVTAGGTGGSGGADGAAAAQLEAVPVVDAQTVFTLRGHGHGHGRGMGQWGAYGYAKDHGWSAEQIINHYYGGTALQRVDTGGVSVRLMGLDGKDLSVTSDGPMTVDGHEVPAGAAVTLRPTPGGADVTVTQGCGGAPGDSFAVGDPRVTPAGGGMLQVCGGNTYRGDLGVALDGGAPRSVNYVGMEDYLRGVLPEEISAGWADKGAGEALRAQAIAARSYAAAEDRYGYAQTCDTQACQVYGGTAEEDPRTDAAVADTAGMVVTRGGQPVATEFSASTGGWTAGGDFPAVEDVGDAASPVHDWTETVTGQQVSDAFGVGPLKEMTVTARNGLGADGGRVVSMRVVGADKTVEVSGPEVRTGLGLKSDWFTIDGQGPAASIIPPESSGLVPDSSGVLPPAVTGPTGQSPEGDDGGSGPADIVGGAGLTAEDIRRAAEAIAGAMGADSELGGAIGTLGGVAADGLEAYTDARVDPPEDRPRP